MPHSLQDNIAWLNSLITQIDAHVGAHGGAPTKHEGAMRESAMRALTRWRVIEFCDPQHLIEITQDATELTELLRGEAAEPAP